VKSSEWFWSVVKRRGRPTTRLYQRLATRDHVPYLARPSIRGPAVGVEVQKAAVTFTLRVVEVGWVVLKGQLLDRFSYGGRGCHALCACVTV